MYTFKSSLSVQQLEAARQVLFTDGVVEESRWDSRPPVPCRWMIQVGMLPGVTDNVGRTATRALEDMLGNPVGGDVYASSLYLLEGDLDYGEVDRLVRDFMANPLVHQWRITSTDDWQDGPQAFLPPPVAGADRPPRVNSVSLDIDDDALLRLSQEGLLALNLDGNESHPGLFWRSAAPDPQAGLRDRARTQRTSNWRPWRRRGRSTASTRSSRAPSNMRTITRPAPRSRAYSRATSWGQPRR